MQKKITKNTHSKDSIEAMLFSLPKNCNCSTCKDTKNLVRGELGDNQYKIYCTQIGIVH